MTLELTDLSQTLSRMKDVFTEILYRASSAHTHTLYVTDIRVYAPFALNKQAS